MSNITERRSKTRVHAIMRDSVVVVMVLNNSESA